MGALRASPLAGIISSAYGGYQSVGSPMDNLNTATISALQIPLSPLIEQAQIVSYFKTELALINEALGGAGREIELARELWTTLVAEVVTGRVDVRDAKVGGVGELALPSLVALGEGDEPSDSDDVADGEEFALET